MYNKVRQYLDNIDITIELTAYYDVLKLETRIAQIRSNLALLRDLGLITDSIRSKYDEHVVMYSEYITNHYNTWYKNHEY